MGESTLKIRPAVESSAVPGAILGGLRWRASTVPLGHSGEPLGLTRATMVGNLLTEANPAQCASACFIASSGLKGRFTRSLSSLPRPAILTGLRRLGFAFRYCR